MTSPRLCASLPWPGAFARADKLPALAPVSAMRSRFLAARVDPHRVPRIGRVLAGIVLLRLALLGDDVAPLRARSYVDPVDEPVAATAVHFLVSNETRHDVFAAAITGRGGAYLGVGADQNYTMIAVSRAERAFLLDHDRKIGALHRELGRRIVAAAGPALLLRGLVDPAEPPPAALADAWPAVARHLQRVAARRRDGRPTTWLGDPVLYATIRDRWRRGAVHVVTGDLMGDTAMASIAAAAISRGLRFSVVYLSNVEETLSAPHRLVRNLLELPRTDDAIVLRTVSRGPAPAEDALWSYQSGPLDGWYP